MTACNFITEVYCQLQNSYKVTPFDCDFLCTLYDSELNTLIIEDGEPVVLRDCTISLTPYLCDLTITEL